MINSVRNSESQIFANSLFPPTNFIPRSLLKLLLAVGVWSVCLNAGAGLVSALKSGAKKAAELSELSVLATKNLGDFDGPVYWSAVSVRIAARLARCEADGRSKSICEEWGKETERCLKNRYPGTVDLAGTEHDPKLHQVAKECDEIYPRSEDMAVLPGARVNDPISWVTVSDRLAEALVQCSKLGLHTERCSEWHKKITGCLTINYPRVIDWQSSNTDLLINKVVIRCDRPLPRK